MKLVKAYLHQVRCADVVQALADAGFRNLALLDARGTLAPLIDSERDFSMDGAGLVIAEVQLDLVCDDTELDTVTSIIRTHGSIGTGISGWVYVSPIDQALPIGSGQVPAAVVDE